MIPESAATAIFAPRTVQSTESVGFIQMIHAFVSVSKAILVAEKIKLNQVVQLA